MKIIAVIQARLNSTRLPRKVLLPLAGKSMLQNVVERVSRAKLIDEIIIAVPMHDFNELRFQHARFGGRAIAPACDENDLISRFLIVATEIKADSIIRICADNPCVEAEQIDTLVRNSAGLNRSLDLNSENFKENYDGFGGELYPLEMLEWFDSLIKHPLYREHPHLIFKEMEAYNYLGRRYPPGFRLDVNTQADYEKVKAIYDHFGHNKFSVKEAMEFLGSQDLEKQPLP